jgi:hypothetical protein
MLHAPVAVQSHSGYRNVPENNAAYPNKIQPHPTLPNSSHFDNDENDQK